MTDLVEGTIYDTAAYGPVQFMNTVPDRTVANGVCHKFKTMCGSIKYIRPYELDCFLHEEED